MFDLQPRVHLHEPDAVRAQTIRCVGDEFDCASTDIVDGFCRFHRDRAKLCACGLIHARRWGFLDHFLVTALERAVAFEQMDDVAVRVAKHLHLNMARALDIFFDQDMGVAERSGSFTLARRERIGKVGSSFDLAHPLAAATCDGLDEHGVADLCGTLGEECRILVLAHITGGDGHAGFGH